MGDKCVHQGSSKRCQAFKYSIHYPSAGMGENVYVAREWFNHEKELL